MSDYQKPVIKKTALKNPKLRLAAPNPAVKGTYASLSFDVYQNNPRLVVDTKDPSMMNKEHSFGRITAAMDAVGFGMFLELLKEMIASPTADKKKIENFGNDYVNGQRSNEVVPLTDIWVGKDAEGIIFVSVISKKPGWPVIKFAFGLSDQRFTKIFHSDGTQYSKAELSALGAKTYYKMLTELVPNVLDTHFYEAPPNPKWAKGGGGGGYNKPSYNQQSSAPAAGGGDDGDDLPF